MPTAAEDQLGHWIFISSKSCAISSWFSSKAIRIKAATPFPPTELDGLHVIASVQVGKGESPEFLQPWLAYTHEEIDLGSLSREDIKAWLKENTELAALADSTETLEKLDEKTDGCPLYLEHLFAELLKNERPATEIIAASPRGFTEYVRRQYDLLTRSEAAQSRAVREVLPLLAAARGELDLTDLAALTGVEAESIRHLPWQVERWIGKANLEHFEDLRRRLFGRLNHEFSAFRGILSFANGSRIIAGHFQNEKDIDAYLGLEYDVIGIEEATTLTARKCAGARESLRASAQTETTTNQSNLWANFYLAVLSGFVLVNKS
jgi:hypothetical protein